MVIRFLIKTIGIMMIITGKNKILNIINRQIMCFKLKKMQILNKLIKQFNHRKILMRNKKYKIML